MGDNQASQVYVRNKVKACEDSGLHSVLEKYEADMTEAALLAAEALNNDRPSTASWCSCRCPSTSMRKGHRSHFARQRMWTAFTLPVRVRS